MATFNKFIFVLLSLYAVNGYVTENSYEVKDVEAISNENDCWKNMCNAECWQKGYNTAMCVSGHCQCENPRPVPSFDDGKQLYTSPCIGYHCYVSCVNKGYLGGHCRGGCRCF